MKRYEPETDANGARLGAMNRDENGDFVHFDDARAEIERLNTKVSELFDAIKHGDQEHQDWLFGAIRKHFGVSDEN